MIIKTTVGRVVFNDILHPRMPFYNLTLGQKQLESIIADCYQIAGRRERILLLDPMKELGFREATRSGLSLATDDMKTVPSKDAFVAEAEHKSRTQACRGTDQGQLPRRAARTPSIPLDLWCSQTSDRSSVQLGP